MRINEEVKPVVRLCARCQEEFPIIKDAIKKNLKNYTFSHGLCKRHLIEYGKEAEFPDGMVASMIKDTEASKEGFPPDLKEHPELVELYSRGIFTKDHPEQVMKERFQKLANITSR